MSERTRAEWAEHITEAWRASLAEVLATGQRLIEAKGALPHGEFGAMIEQDLPFGASTGRRLMAIAKDKRLSDRAHVHVLPPAWGTLYELTKLSDDDFKRAAADGVIRPDVERGEITRFRQDNWEAPENPGGREAAARAMDGMIFDGMQFGAIMADPPWKYETWSDDGQGRSAERHYRTMTVDEIKAVPVGELAAPDCVLFLWCVRPFGREAYEIIEAWGFTFSTRAFTWVKQNPSGEGWHMGPGHWTRANPEICLLAKRGKPRRRDRGVQELIIAPRGEHSEKPAEAYKRVERLVGGPYLDLFARESPEGWHGWGDQAGKAAA